jgi:hypothetical protein
MNLEKMRLTEEEVKKFYDFYEEHIKCGSAESLSKAFNVKLLFNFGNDSYVVTCACSECGEESLIAQPKLFEEKDELTEPI